MGLYPHNYNVKKCMLINYLTTGIINFNEYKSLSSTERGYGMG